MGLYWASQVALAVRNLPANAGDVRDAGSIPGSGRSPGGGHGTPLQYSCLENPMYRGVWRATVRGRTESDTTEVTWACACTHYRVFTKVGIFAYLGVRKLVSGGQGLWAQKRFGQL